MKLKTRILFAIPCLAAFLAVTGAAHASSISGTAYCNIASPSGPTQQGSQYAIEGVTQATLAAAISSGTQCATFTSNSINFDAGYTNNYTTLADFLTSDPGNTTFTSAPAPNQSALGTLLVLTGSTYFVNGQSYDLTHDDGVNLYIGTGTPDTLLIAQGGQTVADQTPFIFNGVTGEYNFQLLYVSNYQAPSELKSTTIGIAQTPEPSSFILLGSGLIGVAGLVRRRMGI